MLIPIRELLVHLLKEFHHLHNNKATVYCTVFEDNQGAYLLAINQRVTNRTRYLSARWHWFWEQYNKGLFNIEKCPTDLQSADYLTKMLSKDLFRNNRRRVQGW